MGLTAGQRIEIDGRPADVPGVAPLLLVNYGHFTAMQVRGGRVRGLRAHLERLDTATRELFGTGLDGERVRDHVRHALGAAAGTASAAGTGTAGVEDVDAAVRVIVFEPAPSSAPSVMVSVAPPTEAPDGPLSLRTATYQRPVAHIKHVGGFGQHYHRRVARDEGYDEALLVADNGVISEGATTNVMAFDGSTATWPDAPALHGTTMRLVEEALAAQGIPSRRATITSADLPPLGTALVTNSIGVVPVDRVDDRPLPVHPDLVATVRKAHAGVPWDRI